MRAGPVLLAGAVVVEDERLLVVRQVAPPDAGMWSLPLAEVAADEPLAAAVVRAVEETTGLEAVCEGPLGHVELLGGEAHRVLLVFGATVLGHGVLAPAATWVELEDIAERPLVEGLPQLLADRGILRLIA